MALKGPEHIIASCVFVCLLNSEWVAELTAMATFSEAPVNFGLWNYMQSYLATVTLRIYLRTLCRFEKA